MTEVPTQLVRSATPEDSEAIASIYNRYVLESTATFELNPVDAAMVTERMANSPNGLRWQVVEGSAGRVVGYASVARWKPRGGYARTVETSVFVDIACQGCGFGNAVYGQLLDEVWAHGYHAALAGIALPNAASVGLHERLGFRPAGVLREVGFKLGRWIDVGYWQALDPGARHPA